MTGPSLRLRLLIASLVGALMVLLAFGAVVYYRARHEVERLFDQVLQTQCQLIAHHVFEDWKTGPGQGSNHMEFLGRILSSDESDFYQITLRNGDTISKAPGLSDALPITPDMYDIEPGEGRSYKVDSFVIPYRMRAARFIRDSGRGTLDIFVLYGEKSGLLEKRLKTLKIYMALTGAAALPAGAIALYVLLGLGLRPLENLSRTLGFIGPRNLQSRLDTNNLPADLRGVAEAVNGLLVRLDNAFERERRFSADAAHELSTPLSVLKANLQSALLSRRDPTDEPTRLRELLEDVERLERLAESLLTISEAESEAVASEEERENLPVQSLLESLRQQFEEEAAVHEVSIAVENDREAVAYVDPLAFERVVINLLENAIRHNRIGGKIWLSAVQHENVCEIRVADDGPGIPEEDVPHLFERFFRVDKSRSRERGGTGLGLAIAKALCESQEGRLNYEPRKGGGSVFIVRVPARLNEA